MNQEDLNPLYITPGGPSMRNTLWWSPFYYNVRQHEVSGFLLSYLITKASNYTCKSCGNKILQQYQIIVTPLVYQTLSYHTSSIYVYIQFSIHLQKLAPWGSHGATLNHTSNE